MTEQRNEEPREIVPVGGALANTAPDWMAEHVEGDESLAGTAEYRVLSRMKVIQGMSDQALKDAFGEGTIIVSPGQIPLAKREEHFDFVPCLFFTEFLEVSDLKDRGSLMILARTFDKGSDLAAKARDPERREEGYGEQDTQGRHQYVKRFVESLCFVGVVYGEHPAAGTPVCLSFQRGEFGKGQAFVSSIRMRKAGAKICPLWAQVWKLTPGFRDRGERKWWGIDFEAPPAPFITREEAPAFKELHQSLKQEFEEQRLIVDREDDDLRDDPLREAEAAAAAASGEAGAPEM